MCTTFPPDKLLQTTLRIGIIGCEDLAKWNGPDCNKLTAKAFEERGLGRVSDPECSNGIPFSDQTQCDGPSQWTSPSIHWVYFDAVRGVLPNHEELKDFDGFILTGSHYSANDPLAWISKFEEWIRQLQHFQKNNTRPPRVVAVCFSHQLVNKALGGTVGPNSYGKFVWNRESVKLLKNASSHPFFKDFLENDEEVAYSIYESHGDCVASLPSGAERLGTSSTCENEIVSIGDDILTIQGHPEFSEHEMVDMILPALRKSALVTDADAKKAMATFKNETDNQKLMKLIEKYFSRV